jgi:hypothetical protein
LSKALADEGHRVDVISGPPYPRLDDNVRLIRLPSLDLYSPDHLFRPEKAGAFESAQHVRIPERLYGAFRNPTPSESGLTPI